MGLGTPASPSSSHGLRAQSKTTQSPLSTRTTSTTTVGQQRLRAHIPGAINIVTSPATLVPFTAIDDNPSGWTVGGSPNWDFTVPESGQYDLTVSWGFASSSNTKIILLYRVPLQGSPEIINGIIAASPTSVGVVSAPDTTLIAGDKISVTAQLNTAAQNLNYCRLSILKRSNPFA